MKKIILLLALTLSTVSFAQLKKVETVKAEEIGKVGPFGAPMQIECTKVGNVYTISYRDIEFKTIDEYRSFEFEDVDNTFEDLYAAIKDGLEKLPEESVTLELPNYILSLEFKKALGVPLVRFYTSPKGSSRVSASNQFTRKQIDKLFGKKK